MPDLVLSNGMQFIIVELSKFNKDLKKIFDQKEGWCYLLKKSQDMDDKDCKILMKKGKDMRDAVKHLWNLYE